MVFPEQNDAVNGVGASGANSEQVSDHTLDAPHFHDEAHTMSEEDYRAYLWLVPEDATPVPDTTPEASQDAWQGDLIMSKKIDRQTKEEILYPTPTSQKNIYLMTRYLPELRGMFILNEFSQRRMLVKCPPWIPENKFVPRDIHDDDYTRIVMELESHGLKPKPQNAMLAIESICRDRSFHPVRRYFEKLAWDGKPRLNRWLTYYLGCETDNQVYLSAVGTKILTAGVARIFEPGCKFDHMIVLEGKTDIGKSKALRTLATFNGIAYFNDSLTFETLFDKDTILNIQGSLIVEFPEMTGITKRDSNEVKQWITIQEDRGRPPYGRSIILYPRQFILAGSTNNDGYLIDTTGNKRFWPVRCGDRIDFDALVADREQLWAEAVALYKSGYKYWIEESDTELIRLFKAAQEERMQRHPWEQAVLSYVVDKEDVTAEDVLTKGVDMPMRLVKRGDAMAVADILRMNGWTQGRVKGRRCWIAPLLR